MKDDRVKSPGDSDLLLRVTLLSGCSTPDSLLTIVGTCFQNNKTDS